MNKAALWKDAPRKGSRWADETAKRLREKNLPLPTFWPGVVEDVLPKLVNVIVNGLERQQLAERVVASAVARWAEIVAWEGDRLEDLQVMSATNELGGVFVGLTRKVLDMTLSGHVLVMDETRELLLHRDWQGPPLKLDHAVVFVAGADADSIAFTVSKVLPLLGKCPYVALSREVVELLTLEKLVEMSYGGRITLGFAETAAELVASMAAHGLSERFMRKPEVLATHN